MNNEHLMLDPHKKALKDKAFQGKKAFTLAEIIVTILILGIVAVMVIPSTYMRATKKANKLKIRKALTSYEQVINKIYIEEGLPRSIQALRDFANNDNSCSNIRAYFNASQADGCIIKTTDGLWWDFGSTRTDNVGLSNKYYDYNISRVMVSFKKSDLTPSKAQGYTYDTFVFVTDIDENGSIRVNDLEYSKKAYEKEDEKGNKGVYGSRRNLQATTKVKAYLEDQTNFSYGVPVMTIGSNRNSSNARITGSTEEDSNGNIICKRSCTVSYISGTTKYEEVYDERGYLVKRTTIDTSGNVSITETQYDKDGYETYHIRTENGKVKEEYSSERDMYGNQTHYDYKDGNGKVKSYMDATYNYDDYGRILHENRISDSSGKGVTQEIDNTYVRDSKGNIIESTQINKAPSTNKDGYPIEGKYNITTYKNHADGTSEYEASGYSENWYYAADGKTRIYNPDKSSTYNYTETYKDGIYTYQEERIYNNGDVHTEKYSYDDETWNYVPGSDYTIKTTDKNGNVLEDYKLSVSKNGNNTTYEERDNITGNYNTWTQDSQGRDISSSSYNASTGYTSTYNTTYNADNSYTAVSQSFNPTTGAGTNNTYNYYSNGRQQSTSLTTYKKDSEGNDLYSNTATTQYNSNGKVTSYTKTGTDQYGNVNNSDTYTYDSQGRLIKKVTKYDDHYTNGSRRKYTETYTYEYDSNGNTIKSCKNSKCVSL